jgi:hypothetical protein
MYLTSWYVYSLVQFKMELLFVILIFCISVTHAVYDACFHSKERRPREEMFLYFETTVAYYKNDINGYATILWGILQSEFSKVGRRVSPRKPGFWRPQLYYLYSAPKSRIHNKVNYSSVLSKQFSLCIDLLRRRRHFGICTSLWGKLIWAWNECIRATVTFMRADSFGVVY